MLQLIPTAEPFFIPGKSDKLGCLLIHGFTGTPKEMRWMGGFLAEQGYSALGIRLAGHATHPRDMIRTRYTDWLASVEDGYRLLRGSVKRVVLIGLSMGGALSLIASTQLEAAGVIAMSTPFELVRDWRLGFINLLSLVMPYMPKGKQIPGAGWFDSEAWKDHVSYPENPVRSIGELNRLLHELRGALPEVHVPTLLIHSRDDGYVLPENAEKIFNALGTRDKELVWVTGSGHVVTRDAARHQVFDNALKFIHRVEGLA